MKLLHNINREEGMIGSEAGSSMVIDRRASLVMTELSVRGRAYSNSPYG